LPDNSDYKFNGKLSIIDRAVDPQTGTIKIRTIFPNPDKLLRPGMNCKLKVLNEYSGMQINIPFRAIVEQMGEYFVFIDKDTVSEHPSDSTNKNVSQADGSKDGSKLRAVQRKVQIGQTIGADVIVLSGLNKGDKVIIDGVQALHDGSAISAGSKPHNSENNIKSGDRKNKPDAAKNNQ